MTRSKEKQKVGSRKNKRRPGKTLTITRKIGVEGKRVKKDGHRIRITNNK